MQIRPWNSRTGVPDSHLNHAVGHSGGHGKHADSLHRLDGIHDHVGKGLSKLLRPRIDSGNRTIVRPNLQAGAFPSQLREFESLAQLGVPDPGIRPVPAEVSAAVPFLDDLEVRPYDREMVQRFQTVLIRTQFVLERFRADFLGKASPAHSFWGSFDLATARFSGRRAPPYAGMNPPNVHPHVMHEAYSHELIAAGFWPGNDDAPQPEFYSYAMPPSAGLANATIRPASAGWVATHGEFILPYEAVRTAEDPAATLLTFLQSTYDVAAGLQGWDRPLLEERPRCNCVRLPSPLARG